MNADFNNRDNDNAIKELVYFSERGDAAEVERLLAAGADPNAKNHGVPALHYANGLDIVRLMVQYGVNIDATDRRGQTAIWRFLFSGQLSCIEFLCFKGAKLDILSIYGWSPMLDAIDRGFYSVVELLCAFDASVDLCEGDTPFMHAVVCNRFDCARLLLALNAHTTNEDYEPIKRLLLERSKESEKERQELRTQTLNRIRHEVGIRLMRYAQPEIVGICLAFASLDLLPYVLLWIIDWLPNYHRLSHHKKIHLIESVRESIWKLKGKEGIV